MTVFMLKGQKKLRKVYWLYIIKIYYFIMSSGEVPIPKNVVNLFNFKTYDRTYKSSWWV